LSDGVELAVGSFGWLREQAVEGLGYESLVVAAGDQLEVVGKQ